MNISGVLLHVYPRNAAAVTEALAGQAGVEVHAVSETGRMVVTVEHAEARMMADTVAEMQNIPGVLSAAMIYHHYEDENETGPERTERDAVPAVLKNEYGNEEASQ